MKESNAYHKFIGYGQKQSGNDFEELKFQVLFDYFNDEISSTTTSLFKGFEFTASSAKLITEDKKGLVANDRVWIDDSPSLITKIHTAEKQKLAGQRFKTRKKIYVIELEV